jgi:hypothetical protein
MKKNLFFTLFAATQILCIVLYIHKSSVLMRASYRKQELEQLKLSHEAKKQELTHQLYIAQNQASIKDFARDQLHMATVKLTQIKTLHAHE